MKSVFRKDNKGTAGLTLVMFLGFLIVFVLMFAMFSNLSGQFYVRRAVSPYIGEEAAQAIPFQMTEEQKQAAQQQQEKLEKQYSIKSLTVSAQENLSNSGTNVNGAYFRVYSAGTDFSDPTVTALGSIAFSSGVAQDTSWNLTVTGKPYDVVFDGQGTWYDEIARNYVFETQKYNEYTGDYTIAITVQDPSPFPSAPTKIGTLSVTLSNASGSGCSVSGSSIDYNKDASGSTGTCSFDMQIKNTAANTVIRKLVLHPQNSIGSTALEGNEISSVTISTKNGSIELPQSDITNYFTNYQALPIGNLTTGNTTTFTLTFTFNESNLSDGEKFYIMLDDLGGYLQHDVLPSNSGMSPTTLTVTFDQ